MMFSSNSTIAQRHIKNKLEIEIVYEYAYLYVLYYYLQWQI